MVGTLQCRQRVLFHQNNGNAIITKAADNGENFRHDQRRQSEARLVEHQHARLGHQCPPQCQHLPLAAGQGIGALRAALQQTRKTVVDAIELAFAHRSGVALAVTSEQQIVEYRQFAEELPFFRHQAQAGALPLGTQRMLEIARALVADPVMLVLDEPAAGLRHAEKQALGDLLRQLRREGVTIMIVEHDMDFVMKLVDRLVVMNFGCKLMEGDPATVRRDSRVQAAYLGGTA